MTIKQFLKPDWRKIVLTVVLLFFVFIIVISQTSCFYVECSRERIMSNPEGCGEQCGLLKINDLRFTFIISIIIAYLLSYLIIWIYDKFKSVKVKK